MTPGKASVAMAAFAVCGLTVGTWADIPDIGGNPMHTEEDYLTDGSLWGVSLYSYVFDSTFVPPVEFGQDLQPGEMLFAYLFDADDALTIAVNHFAIGNPNMALITLVDFETDIEPTGFNSVDREDPFVYGYSPTAQSSIFAYNNPLDPYAPLDPNEWSLVFYVAEAAGWALGPATGSGAGISANVFVPVPIPAPGAWALLAMGLLWRRRR